MPHSFDTQERPLAIAHRAANDLARLRETEDADVDLAECDLWLHRGRLEVRHLKTLGPLPLLWDRWKLAPAWAPRLRLGELLDAARPGTGLMLDLKGRDRGLPRALLRALADAAMSREIVVCSRNWDLLEPFRNAKDVAVLHSVGSTEQLAAVASRLTWHDRHGVSIHLRLLTPEVVRELKRHAPTLVTWPVNDEATMWRLLDWGVDGVTSDSLDVLRALVAARRDGSASRPSALPSRA